MAFIPCCLLKLHLLERFFTWGLKVSYTPGAEGGHLALPSLYWDEALGESGSPSADYWA